MNTGLHGKVVIITGASRGIGKAIAYAFANEGARLVLCARSEEQLVQVQSEIKDKFHTEVFIVKANISRLNDIKRVVSKTVSKFKRIDVLVNNAGGAFVGGIFQMTDEELENHINLKLVGYIRTAREVIPFMQQQGGGKIINIIGTAGKEPTPTMMVPGITNSALLNFTKSLALELAKDNITVNAVNPGSTETPLTETILGSLAVIQTKTPDEIRQAITSANPFGRLALPEDIAAAVIFFASETSAYVSGISINVDGGMSRGSS
jgi:3-oxoacyl-[acyl-carrier protein] reductase